MGSIQVAVKQMIKRMPVAKDYAYGINLYKKYSREHGEIRPVQFFVSHHAALLDMLPQGNKGSQFSKFLSEIDICPANNDTFFYAIDCFKRLQPMGRRLDNYMIDYGMVVQHSFAEIRERLCRENDGFSQSGQTVIDSLQEYLNRCQQSPEIVRQYEKQLAAISSLFERPAETLFEGLQRILFYNQFLWQTGRMLNGLGRLDMILDGAYSHDIATGTLTRDGAKGLLREFFRVLHEFYWFKSNALMGDTGQIIILGGRMSDGGYFRNDLTDLFIEVSEELKQPDPKVLLRCTADMPEDLLKSAVNCIATGIGAPLLSNDDVVIPALLSDGYNKEDAYHYGTAACWEPLIPGLSCDQNNIATLNFAVPLVRMLEEPDFEAALSEEELLRQYQGKLRQYIRELLIPLTTLRFEEDPLLSIVSQSALEARCDITQGGAKYNNLGLTSVGLGTVVNSLINLKRLVFEEKKFTLHELNVIRRQDYSGHDELVKEMKEPKSCYGCDDGQVIALAKEIIDMASREFKEYNSDSGGHFKFGLSSPGYIMNAKGVAATFDGRKSGEPFSVHISSAKAIPATELMSFATQLDYNENRLNGNVIDFFVTPGTLRQNLQKYVAMLRAGFKGGIFQLQMNVVESKTLIAAKAHPELFPQLVVRVWGFSAYFNDLPEEYKDILIARAIESEKTA